MVPNPEQLPELCWREIAGPLEALSKRERISRAAGVGVARRECSIKPKGLQDVVAATVRLEGLAQVRWKVVVAPGLPN